MIDDRYPPLADGLFDGGLAADVAPKNLRTAVSLLNAAGRPGSEAELASMAARVRQFSAEVNAAAKSSKQRATSKPSSFATTEPRSGAYGDTGLCSEASFSPATLRNSPIFATRVTRKALTVVAITLLAAGTAAAAAGGTLPMLKEAAAAVVGGNGNVLVVDGGNYPSHTGQTAVDRSAREGSPAPVVEPEVTVEPTDYYSQCAVWMNGAAANATSASFAALLSVSEAAALTIDEYCNTVLVPPAAAEVPVPDSKTPDGNKPADNSPKDDSAAVPPDVSPPDVSPPAVAPPAVAPPADNAPGNDQPADSGNGNGTGDDNGHGNGNHDHDHGNHGNHGNYDHDDHDEHGNHGGGGHGNNNHH